MTTTPTMTAPGLQNNGSPPAQTDLDALAHRLIAVVKDTLAQPSLAEVKAALNEAGLSRARQSLATALENIGVAQETYRMAQSAEAEARQAHDEAVAEADWAIDSARFTAAGNKTLLRSVCDRCNGSKTIATVNVDGDGKEVEATEDCPACQGTGETQKSMTADERARWKAVHVAKVPTVVGAANQLRSATERTAAARDAITLADKRFSAARADLDAAIAHLRLLGLAIGVAHPSR